MLNVCDITFRYRKDMSPVLDRVSFSLTRGVFAVLLGANGSGKTTLLNLLTGCLTPESGNITLDGTAISALPARIRSKQLATAFQTQEELPDFTVRELVMLGRNPYLSRLGSPGENDLRSVADALTLLELTDLADRNIRHLSGGERQRVLLAAVLARKSPYLLLDEPTAAADPAYRVSIIRLLKNLPWKPGILTVTHDIAVARAFADRFLLLHSNGKLENTDTLTAENIGQLYGKDAAFFLNPS